MVPGSCQLEMRSWKREKSLDNRAVDAERAQTGGGTDKQKGVTLRIEGLVATRKSDKGWVWEEY